MLGRWLKSCCFAENFGKSATVEILHHQIRDSFAGHARKTKVGDVDDVWMMQSSGRLSFAFEALDEFVVHHELRCDYFNRDGPVGAEMSGQINGAHPAPAEFFVDAVFLVEYFAGQLCQSHRDLRELNARTATHVAAFNFCERATTVFSELSSIDRKSTRLNSSHTVISYAVFCLKKKR